MREARNLAGMLTEAVAVAIDVENFALVTHRVPADRVRRHLAPTYDLETFGEGTGEYCFVSATCFCNRNFRLNMLRNPHHTFNETTYRTYVSFKGRRGVFFFGRYLGTPLALIPQRLLSRDVFHAEFDLSIERGPQGYISYVCSASSSQGETSFSLEATDQPPQKPPWESGEEHGQYLTYRLDGYFTSSMGFQAHSPVSHQRMRPFSGRLHEGRFELWEQLGIVPREEANKPYSILVTPGAHFTLYPPRPAI
jgi:uncharacterized protein YqjF (DUF2071 family)